MGNRPTVELADAELIRQALAGDDLAFRQLVLRYQGPVFACTRAITGNSADAADAAQEAFIRLHRHLRQVDPARPLRPYLLRIAANCSRTLLSRRRPQDDTADATAVMAAVADPAGSPAQRVLAAERRSAVRALVRSLPRTLREVCSLFYLADCACSEVAETLEMSETAVKVALHRARLRLRESGLAEWRTTP